MPGSIPNPVPLLVLKVVGYSVAGVVLNRIFKKNVCPIWFGVFRTVVGLGLGLLTILLAALITPVVWYVILRIGIWYLMIWYFYERKGYSDKTFRIAVLLGIAWSFLLDGILYLLSSIFPDSFLIPMC